MQISLETLPVDLISVILSELDLESLIKVTYLSKRLYTVASDESLNPWRHPIQRNLYDGVYEQSMTHLAVRRVVPRQNWVDILSTARSGFILFEATLPNLSSSEWEECFRRRFPPSWVRWRKDGTWKGAFLKVLHRVWHRSTTSCTIDEAWTKYIILNRNGSANELESTSRGFDPFHIFDEVKLQCNMHHLPSACQIILELPDIRFMALGTVDRPKTSFPVNANAHFLMNPPGINENKGADIISKSKSLPNPISGSGDYGVYPKSAASIPAFLFEDYVHPSTTYTRLFHPHPTIGFVNYPYFTPGGKDARWDWYDYMLEHGLHWVGGMMILAQIRGQNTESDGSPRGTQAHYASFCWDDLFAIAPWLNDRISKRITGAGLGN